MPHLIALIITLKQFTISRTRCSFYVALIIATIYIASILAVPLSISASADSASPLASTPKITLRPLDSSPGKTVKVTGVYFATSSSITVSFAGGSIASTISNSTGGFVVSFVVPTSTPAGLYPVSAMDASGLSASNILTIALSPKITLSTGGSSHAVGVMVSVSGTGFKPNSPIEVYFNNQLVASSTTNSQGTFSGSFTVPTVTAGTYSVNATDGTNYGSKTFAIKPQLKVSPTGSVTVGSKLTVTGTGYAANSLVSFTLVTAKITTKVTSSLEGTFSIQITIPNVAKGGYFLVGTDASSNTAEVHLSISN